jgi:hypothetical protein
LSHLMNQRIEYVGRDHSGITTIVTSSGVIDAQIAIEHIRSGRVRFVAGPTSWDRAQVVAREAFGGPYLFANWDGTRRNNLHELALLTREPAHRIGTHRSVGRLGSALRLVARTTATLQKRFKGLDRS